jgi:O-antigen ligase
VVLSLLIVVGPIVNSLRQDLSGEGNPFRQISYVLVFCLLLVATRRWRAIEAALDTSLPVAVLLLWCWISIAWAINPGIAVRRLVLTTLIIASVFISVKFIGREKTLKCIRSVFLLVLFLNFAMALAFPQIGVHAWEYGGEPGLVGDWRGIFPEKNLAGAVTAVTLLMLYFDKTSKTNLVHLSLILMAMIFLVKTGSKTSMGIGLAALASGVLYRRYDHRYWPAVMVGLAFAALVAAVLLYANLPRILAMLDRPDLLTGRTQIWSSLLDYVKQNWLLGAGYGSFWNIGPASPIFSYAKPDAWLTKIASGHNGFLDLATQIGVPGVALAVLALFIHPLGKLLTDFRLKSDGPLLIALLVFCAGQNMTESTMLDRDQVIQFCLIWTIAAIFYRPAAFDSTLASESGSSIAPSDNSTPKQSSSEKGANGIGAQDEGSP